jgi:hypothetical protein
MNELEDDFKLITLSNDNNADLYFKLLSTLAKNKKEQQRLRAIIDKACLDYLKDNEAISNELLEHKYNKNNVIDILNEPIIKEIRSKINELGSIINELIKEYSFKIVKDIIENDIYCYYGTYSTPTDYYNRFSRHINCKDLQEYLKYCNIRKNIENKIKDISDVLKDNNLVKNSNDCPYIKFRNTRIILKYDNDECDLSKLICDPIDNQSIKILDLDE